MRRANTRRDQDMHWEILFQKGENKITSHVQPGTFLWKITAMYRSANDSQRFQGFQKLCVEFSIRFSSQFSDHNKRAFLRLHR